MELFDRIKKVFASWHYSYILLTGLYMLEEWEQRVFNSVLLVFIAMASYTAYLFLPGHIVMLARFIEHYVGSPEIESVPDIPDM